MMKKLISLLCVLTMVIAVVAVSAVSANGAVDSAKTKVDVKNGQDVTYRLKLGGVESKVIGSDFSVYYDPAVLEVVSVLDFSDNDEDNWEGTWIANPNKSGEVIGNFSILRGVKFDETRSFITVKFKAKADASTDISYFIRYLYDYKPFTDEAMTKKLQPQITEFKFTCDVQVDGETVLEDAQPELNVDQSQDKGMFINTVTGDSNDTDPDVAGVVFSKEKAAAAYDYAKTVSYDPAVEDTILYGSSDSDDAGSGSGDNGGGSGSDGVVGGSGGGSGSGNGSGSSSSSAPEADETLPPKTSDGYYITAVDDNGNALATVDEAHYATPTSATGSKGGSSPVLWIVIAVVLLAACGAGAYFYMKKKKGAAPSAEAEAPTPDNTETKE